MGAIPNTRLPSLLMFCVCDRFCCRIFENTLQLTINLGVPLCHHCVITLVSSFSFIMLLYHYVLNYMQKCCIFNSTVRLSPYMHVIFVLYSDL